MLKYISLLEGNNELDFNKKAKLFYFKAYQYRISDNDSLSFLYYKKSLELAEKIKDSLTELASLSGLAQASGYDGYDYRIDYLEKLKAKAHEYKNNRFRIIASFLKGNYYYLRNENKKAVNAYNNTLKLKFEKSDSTYLINTINNLGALYNENFNMPDSANYYYRLKLKIIDGNKTFQNSVNYFSVYTNLGSSYSSLNKFEEAEKYYKQADSIPIVENVLLNKSVLKRGLSDLYEKQGKYQLAYNNFKQFSKLKDSLNSLKHAETINKYDNQGLRLKNIEIETKRKQNRNLLMAALTFILFGGITAFLIQKNTLKKQKLAEQEKALETQKLATVLKEQELASIDAMIAGQEKERQRIANDLHDDLGGMMATVKLHFNALKEHQTPELFNKTNALLDEAYNKIRTISHAKNSGVIAKQGLLKAVRNMAEKISASNKISIDVVDHGLEDRLENSLELTIFRIIQELITNVIKHAEATEVTIHLTNHDDTLNIMVEDNGKGFNPSQITTKNKGMGISSIDKRVEHLNGTMNIESEANRGTSVIIDIPL
jgi:signal transduction histidine kinase